MDVGEGLKIIGALKMMLDARIVRLGVKRELYLGAVVPAVTCGA